MSISLCCQKLCATSVCFCFLSFFFPFCSLKKVSHSICEQLHVCNRPAWKTLLYTWGWGLKSAEALDSFCFLIVKWFVFECYYYLSSVFILLEEKNMCWKTAVTLYGYAFLHMTSLLLKNWSFPPCFHSKLEADFLYMAYADIMAKVNINLGFNT